MVEAVAGYTVSPLDRATSTTDVIADLHARVDTLERQAEAIMSFLDRKLPPNISRQWPTAAPETTECGICGGEATLVNERREAKWGEHSAVVDHAFYLCGGCGEALYEPGQMDAIIDRVCRATGAERHK